MNDPMTPNTPADVASLPATLTSLVKRLRDGDWNMRTPEELAECVADAIMEAIATTEQPGSSVQGEAVRKDWQKRCLEVGFEYWRAPDSHGVECTHDQAKELLEDLLGVEVEFTTPPPAPAAEQGDAAADRWVAIKPEGAPYWGIHTETGETIAGTSSGLSEGAAKRIVALHNNELCEADDLLRELGLDPARFRSEGGWLNPGKVRAALLHPHDYAGLYLTPPAIQPEARGVEGMVLVPREPTGEMHRAWSGARPGDAVPTDDGGWEAPAVSWFAAKYCAMLAAAPAAPGVRVDESLLLQAVARGWCSPENSHKVMDPALANAIVAEVAAALATDGGKGESNAP